MSELQSGWRRGKLDTYSVLGTVLGGLNAMPRSRHRCSHFTGEENVDCGHSAIGARLPKPYAVGTLPAVPPAPPSPHLTPVNSWEVTVIFAERQLKGWSFPLIP